MEKQNIISFKNNNNNDSYVQHEQNLILPQISNNNDDSIILSQITSESIQYESTPEITNNNNSNDSLLYTPIPSQNSLINLSQINQSTDIINLITQESNNNDYNSDDINISIPCAQHYVTPEIINNNIDNNNDDSFLFTPTLSEHNQSISNSLQSNQSIDILLSQESNKNDNDNNNTQISIQCGQYYITPQIIDYDNINSNENTLLYTSTQSENQISQFQSLLNSQTNESIDILLSQESYHNNDNNQENENINTDNNSNNNDDYNNSEIDNNDDDDFEIPCGQDFKS